MAVQKFELKGKDELIAKLKAFESDVETGASDVVKAQSMNAAKAIKSQIPDGGGEPSKAGEAPHSQKSRLKRSSDGWRFDLKGAAIHWKLAKAELGEKIMAWVYVRFPKGNSYYGHMLEYGTSKMAARPFFWPVINRMKGDAERAMRKVINKAQRNWSK